MPTGPELFDLRDAPEVLAEFRRARVVRRRWFFGAAGLAGLAACLVAWVAGRQFLASSWLEANGIRVDWQFDAETWRLGGVTSARARSSQILGPNTSRASELAALADLHRVEELDLAGRYGLRDDELAVIEKLTDLRILNLDRARARDYPWLGQAQSSLTDATLARMRGLRHLRELNVGGSRITDAGLANLAGLAELESLDLTRTPITDAGLGPLKGLKGLKSLILTGTRVTPAGVGAFEAARPDVRVIHDPAP